MAPGEIQSLTPSIDALYTPDIDGALDEESAKRDFWRAFRALGRSRPLVGAGEPRPLPALAVAAGEGGEAAA